MRIAYVVAIFLSIVLTAPMVMGTEGGTAKVLIIGFPQHIQLVSIWFEADPMVDPRQVPARAHQTTLDESDIQRFIRIYFPRTYEDLLEYEYFMLLVLEIFQFTQEQQKMLHDAIALEGRGAIQDRSVMSTGEWISIPWAESMLSNAFPNDADRVVGQRYSFSQLTLRYVINSNPNVPEIFSPYSNFDGVEAVITHPYWTCIAIPKEGAIVTSYIIGAFQEGFGGVHADERFESPGWMPHTMYWEYGNATTWTHHDSVGQDLYWDPARNAYSIDMLLAEFLFSTGRQLPKDVLLVHNLRLRFATFAASKGFIYSILDFVEKFGASSEPVIGKIREIDEAADRGREEYLGQAYVASYDTMEGAIDDIEALRSEALKLKDRALFWVYLTEWLAISGVSLLSSFLIWNLMVHRRLYREVEVTRGPPR